MLDDQSHAQIIAFICTETHNERHITWGKFSLKIELVNAIALKQKFGLQVWPQMINFKKILINKICINPFLQWVKGARDRHLFSGSPSK